MQVHCIDGIPEGLLDLTPENLHTLLTGPTLLRIPGEKPEPLFVATLLHGNEPTGFFALRTLLKQFRETQPPRTLWVFFGNIDAAKNNVRHLSEQPDYNRIWNGGELPEHMLANQLLELLKKEALFAAVDVHNSSGKNPHYACINLLDAKTINLGRMFHRTLVYFTRPDNVLSIALSGHCPSVTLETGPAEDKSGVQHVVSFLENLLAIESLPGTIDGKDPFDVFQTLARIEIPKGNKVAFHKTEEPVDFVFLETLDRLNFSELSAGTLIGWRNSPDGHLKVIGQDGNEVEEEYLHYVGNEIRLARPVVPSMLTTKPEAVYQDCLGYIMERRPLDV